jgi:hypothetical protein
MTARIEKERQHQWLPFSQVCRTPATSILEARLDGDLLFRAANGPWVSLATGVVWTKEEAADLLFEVRLLPRGTEVVVTVD